MSSSEPRSRKKSRGRFWFAITIAAAAVAAFIVYRNNTEVFKPRIATGGTMVPSSDKKPALHQSPPQGRNKPVFDTAVVPIEPSAGKNVSPDPVRAEVSPAVPVLRQSVLIPNIECGILDDHGVKVVLSLELFFQDESLRDEVLVKRDQLKVMVRKALSTKRFDEIQVEPLRSELRTVLNQMLHTGAITDIEFRAFRIQ